jgi:hypothetical protein
VSSYDFYADMYATHSEIGYLLALGLMLLACDGGLAVLIGRWPPPDVYLVPGVVAYGEVPVVWSRQPPRPAAATGNAQPTMLQVSLSTPPDQVPDRPDPGSDHAGCPGREHATAGGNRP